MGSLHLVYTMLHKADQPSQQHISARVLTVEIWTMWQVRDAAFLFRYNEPVLLLLHEAGLDWAGRARRGGKDGTSASTHTVSIC